MSKTKKKERTVLAWHFLARNKKLGYKDGREVIPGEALSVGGRSIIMCSNGLHASKNILDALKFAEMLSKRHNQKWIICRVRLSGEFKDGYDKLCARTRKVIWMLDGKEVLKKYYKKCGTTSGWSRSILGFARFAEKPNPKLLEKLVYNEAKKQGLIKRRKSNGRKKRK